MAGKHDATFEEIKTFVQRRCQYAQLIPGLSGMQTLNQVYNCPERQQGSQQTQTNNSTGKATVNREVKRKLEGNCQNCNIVGHKRIECRKRLRDKTNGINTRTQQRPQQEDANDQHQQTDKPRYNSKLVCQEGGKVGHSVRDC